MNVSDSREQVEADTVNVFPLFKKVNREIVVDLKDPLQELLKEAGTPDIEPIAEMRERKVVNLTQFPDQSMYILEEQLANLRSSLNRIKFYLGDIDDLLPR